MAPPAAEATSFWDISHLYPAEWGEPWHLFLQHLCINTTCQLSLSLSVLGEEADR
jgi:hypothetical protein